MRTSPIAPFLVQKHRCRDGSAFLKIEVLPNTSPTDSRLERALLGGVYNVGAVLVDCGDISDGAFRTAKQLSDTYLEHSREINPDIDPVISVEREQWWKPWTTKRVFVTFQEPDLSDFCSIFQNNDSVYISIFDTTVIDKSAFLRELAGSLLKGKKVRITSTLEDRDNKLLLARLSSSKFQDRLFAVDHTPFDTDKEPINYNGRETLIFSPYNKQTIFIDSSGINFTNIDDSGINLEDIDEAFSTYSEDYIFNSAITTADVKAIYKELKEKDRVELYDSSSDSETGITCLALDDEKFEIAINPTSSYSHNEDFTESIVLPLVIELTTGYKSGVHISDASTGEGFKSTVVEIENKGGRINLLFTNSFSELTPNLQSIMVNLMIELSHRFRTVSININDASNSDYTDLYTSLSTEINKSQKHKLHKVTNTDSNPYLLIIS